MKYIILLMALLHALATISLAQDTTASSSGGKNMNPAIGVVGHFRATQWLHKPVALHAGPDLTTDEESVEYRNGFSFAEAELSFRMTLDPYARADFFIAVVPPEEAVELEEGYLTLLGLPHSLQLKVGKFRSAFGKLNLIHPPETDFADVPLPIQNFFGPEGLAETGLSASILISNPWDQYLEFRAEITNGDNDVSFNADATDDLLYLAQLKGFFEMGESNSLELGLSGLTGRNDEAGDYRTDIFGAHFSFKRKSPRQGLYKALALSGELLLSRREMFDERDHAGSARVNSYGFFLAGKYQFSRRWEAGVRFDYSQFPADDWQHENAVSGILTFRPSEFQRLRLQYRYLDRNFFDKESGLFFQWIFIIGAHGAHPF